MPPSPVFKSFYESLTNATDDVVGLVSGYVDTNDLEGSERSSSQSTQTCKTVENCTNESNFNNINNQINECQVKAEDDSQSSHQPPPEAQPSTFNICITKAEVLTKSSEENTSAQCSMCPSYESHQSDGKVDPLPSPSKVYYAKVTVPAPPNLQRYPPGEKIASCCTEARRSTSLQNQEISFTFHDVQQQQQRHQRQFTHRKQKSPQPFQIQQCAQPAETRQVAQFPSRQQIPACPIPKQPEPIRCSDEMIITNPCPPYDVILQQESSKLVTPSGVKLEPKPPCSTKPDDFFPPALDCPPMDYVIIPKVKTCGDMATAAVALTAKAGSELTRKAVISALRSPGGFFVRIGGLSGFVAVVMGAYAAHVFFEEDDSEGSEDGHKKEVFNIANRYHFIHSVALLTTPFFRYPKFTGTLLAFGIILFCGSCYAHALTGNQEVRRATPYGGVFLIAAWLSMLL